MAIDFILNDQGKNIARIVNEEIFSSESERLIATTRNGNIYGLDGRLLGHLVGAGFVRGEGDSTPAEFMNLLKSA